MSNFSESEQDNHGLGDEGSAEDSNYQRKNRELTRQKDTRQASSLTSNEEIILQNENLVAKVSEAVGSKLKTGKKSRNFGESSKIATALNKTDGPNPDSRVDACKTTSMTEFNKGHSSSIFTVFRNLETLQSQKGRLQVKSQLKPKTNTGFGQSASASNKNVSEEKKGQDEDSNCNKSKSSAAKSSNGDESKNDDRNQQIPLILNEKESANPNSASTSSGTSIETTESDNSRSEIFLKQESIETSHGGISSEKVHQNLKLKQMITSGQKSASNESILNQRDSPAEVLDSVKPKAKIGFSIDHILGNPGKSQSNKDVDPKELSSEDLQNRSIEQPVEEMHQREHNCDECGKTFQCITQLEDHYVVHKLHHKTFCMICKKNLDSHVYNHHGMLIYKCCCECPKEFYNKFELRNHLYYHMPLRLFKCEYCGNRYNRKRLYYNHVQTHPRCEVCKIIFIDDNSVDEHCLNEHK